MPQQKLTLRDTVKIAVIGPESSGKSTLVQHLAAHFSAPFVPEFARAYLEGKGSHAYDFNDLEAIAQGQLAAMNEASTRADRVVFFDTDLVTLHIWALDKFNKPIPLVEENLRNAQADLYLVCKPDIPWQPDPLREDSLRRDDLLAWNLEVLKSLGAQAEIITGTGEARTNMATQSVERFLEKTLG
jgi:NadR type nicotinamide-nucleotide adenylyltransferase